MFLGFTNVKITNNCKLLSHNLSFLWGKIYLLFFLKLNRTPTVIPFVKWGRSSYDGIQERWDTGGEGIIIRDNPAGYYFLLKDLIPMKFFK